MNEPTCNGIFLVCYAYVVVMYIRFQVYQRPRLFRAKAVCDCEEHHGFDNEHPACKTTCYSFMHVQFMTFFTIA
jgi:hypothetical protein